MDDTEKAILGLYEFHDWKVHELSHDQLNEVKKEKVEELRGCALNSQVARDHFERRGNIDGLFFGYDEYEMAGYDPSYGWDGPHRLTQEFNGHPAGKLCMTTYHKISENPSIWLFFVEV